MRYLPLCAACVGVHLFISIAAVIDAAPGLLYTVTEELHFQLIFPVAIHIGYLAKYLASHPGKWLTRRGPNDYRWASSQISRLAKPTSFFYFVPPAMHARGSELKFSSINNIHSLSLTISQQWECGMNALDSADIQLWWIEWRLSVHNAIALPHWAVYFGLIVCCLRANC